MSDDRGPDESWIPAYAGLTEKELNEKACILNDIISDCTLCPRNCHLNRTVGQHGFCRSGHLPSVSSWGPHLGEEKPLVGRHGSGTIFLSNCNLGCLFCQNYTISHLGEGAETSFETLADIMISLQNKGCHNINFVTPTHQIAAIVRAVGIASGKGLRLPLVYNCGGYESVETLKVLDGIIDIYMPDFKYWDSRYAGHYSGAEDYPQIARSALKEMQRQVGDLVIDSSGLARKGLLLRHLVLPAGIAGTEEIMRFVAGEISVNTYVNIMDQYHPCYKAVDDPLLDRPVTSQEYRAAIQAALRAGLRRIDGVTC